MGIPRSLVIGTFSEDLICRNCQQLLKDPTSVSCGHFFCRECVEGTAKRSRQLCQCPVCEAELKYPVPAELSVPSWIPIELDTLTIYCPQKCDEQVELKLLQEHVGKVCPKDMIACPNAFAGCKVNVTRATIAIHLEKCMYRKVKCSACGQEVVNAELFKHQMRRKCHERAMKVDLARSIRRCNSQVKLHNEEMKNDLHRSMQENRKIVLSHWGSRGIKGFDKFIESTPVNGPLNTPVSRASRKAMVPLSRADNNQKCAQCSKGFRSETNHETACVWHAGEFSTNYDHLVRSTNNDKYLFFRGCALLAEGQIIKPAAYLDIIARPEETTYDEIN